LSTRRSPELHGIFNPFSNRRQMSVTEPVKTYTYRFWGKSDRHAPERIHLLEHHLADVGACFEALLRQRLIRQRLAHTARWHDIDGATVARLCVFAALHDIGKVNVGFQTQIWRREDHPSGVRPPGRAGHTADLMPVLNGNDTTASEWFWDALGWWWDAAETWDDCGGETVCGLLVSALSHHGRPLQLDDGRSEHPQLWRRFGDLDPQEQVSRIGRLVREWFPAAFAAGGSALPSTPAFQHHFLGLCNLADWIGSNRQWFPFVDEPREDYIDTARARAHQAVDQIGVDLATQRQSAAQAGVPTFAGLFPHIAAANAIQSAVDDAPLAERLIIIESETGSGKTEAALWRFARLYEAGLVDGLYFALPTRAAAVQIHGRVQRFVSNLFPPEHRPAVVLAVPGYDPGEDAAGIGLAEYDGQAAGHPDNDKPWASENPKRFLTAQIAVGTVDQAMLGSLKVKNAHMRAASLARNLLVVDEVHASDTYMSEILAATLDAHLGAGGYALLMSATLGSVARRRWLGETGESGLADAIDVPYPAVSAPNVVADAGENNQAKTVGMAARPIMREPATIARVAWDAARAGARALVVRNTVSCAVAAHQAVLDLAGDEMSKLLHHGRYAAGDRKRLDGCVEKLLGKGSPRTAGCVVVGTQTLEQSLDIDADLLITDLCPADVLLQRIGRLHRHPGTDRPAGYAAPQCIVLTPAGDDLAPLLDRGQDANGLGPHGYVYEDARVLQATLGLIDQYPQWRIPEMNRLLVERATHPTALADIEARGEEWREHGIKVRGGAIGDWQTARNAIIRRDKSFFEDNREVLFPSDDERIRTRLGDDRVEIAFDPPPASPCDGQPIERIAMTVRWLDKSDRAPEAVEPTATEGGGFEFRIGGRRFRYDRLGLRRLIS
jgi:CRISPR-associated endonuclease/helicase Cas3